MGGVPVLVFLCVDAVVGTGLGEGGEEEAGGGAPEGGERRRRRRREGGGWCFLRFFAGFEVLSGDLSRVSY